MRNWSCEVVGLNENGADLVREKKSLKEGIIAKQFKNLETMCRKAGTLLP